MIFEIGVVKNRRFTGIFQVLRIGMIASCRVVWFMVDSDHGSAPEVAPVFVVDIG